MSHNQIFILKSSTDLNELGEYTQIDTVHGIYDKQSKYIIQNLKNGEILPSYTVFPDLRMYSRAKYTDIFTQVFIGFRYLILSPKAISIFQQYSLGQHQLYECLVHCKNDVRKYIILYLINDNTNEFIDWEKSVFTYWQNKGHLEGDRIIIHNEADYLTRIRDLHYNPYSKISNSIRLKSLALNNESITRFDLFRLSIPALGHYFSKNLVERIKKEGLTGFAFESVEEMNAKQENIKPWPGYGGNQ